ncbi:MAG: divalent-cation tolerance protein CutA [Pseudomonadota bacterium]|nr:divalent-cation tolerance protein CutA [Pseudomonadota bacterium]
MKTSALSLVITTVSTRQQAQALARDMVAKRLAACVQLQAIDSVYRWQGAVQEDSEWRLLLKTTAQQAPALMQALRAAHPYALPALLHLTAHATADFAAWVAAEADAA